MIKKYLLLVCFLPVFVQAQSPDYVDEEALFMKIVRQVQ